MVIDLFHLIDRRCRHPRPRVRDLRDRAILLKRMGFLKAAARDVECLLGLTHQDMHVFRWIMECHSDQEVRRKAAWTIMDSDQATALQHDAAVAHLIGAGQSIVLRATRRAGMVIGWVAWAGQSSPSLYWMAEGGVSGELVLPTDQIEYDGSHVRRLKFEFSTPDDLGILLSARAGATSIQHVAITPTRQCLGVTDDQIRASLYVVLPVFGDLPSLKLCLDALKPQLDSGIRLVIVDDASPDPFISAQAKLFAQEVGGIYHHFSVNSGFASAVNAGLFWCPEGDVLLLNSDVILPPDALRRLKLAALSADDIATVSPFSSDAGSVTFPDPLAAGATPSVSDRLAIDRVARTVNAATIVDILAAHASCLYVTQRWRRLVGVLSLSYGRGYYEDVDFMLRAHQHGLRNVAACDVFVTHLGSRSFGPSKHALIARNHAILCRRFPDFERDDLAFDMADPLRSARGAVEAQAPVPIDETVLLIAPAYSAEALIRRRLSDWERLGRSCCVARMRGIGSLARLELSVTSGSGPRSLRFALDRSGCHDLVNYLSFWSRVEVELLRPDITLGLLSDLLAEAGHPVTLIVDGRASAQVAKAQPDRTSGSNHVALRRVVELGQPQPGSLFRLPVLDRVTKHVVEKRWLVDEIEADGRSTVVEPPRSRIPPLRPVIGVLYPTPGAAEERFILDLARWMRRRCGIQILVLGFAIDEQQLTSPGNVWVSGLKPDEDPAEVLSHYGVCAVLSPYRSSHVWYFNDVAERLGIPGAFFDWSLDETPLASGRLALDPDLSEVESYAVLEAWVSRMAQPNEAVIP